MIKYSYAADSIEEPKIWTQSEVLISSSRLFMAERNFYLVGSTLFLFLVIRRVAELITRDAKSKDTMIHEVKAPGEILLRSDAVKQGVKSSSFKECQSALRHH